VSGGGEGEEGGEYEEEFPELASKLSAFHLEAAAPQHAF
jgi:hypothetical protein